MSARFSIPPLVVLPNGPALRRLPRLNRAGRGGEMGVDFSVRGGGLGFLAGDSGKGWEAGSGWLPLLDLPMGTLLGTGGESGGAGRSSSMSISSTPASGAAGAGGTC